MTVTRTVGEAGDNPIEVRLGRNSTDEQLSFNANGGRVRVLVEDVTDCWREGDQWRQRKKSYLTCVS